MFQDRVEEILLVLNQIQEDASVPRNVREKLKNASIVLQEDTDIAIKVDKSLQELDDLAEDPNIPPYTRTQIWNIVSLLESI